MKSTLSAAAIACALAACAYPQAQEAGSVAATSNATQAPVSHEHLTLAQAACADCHAVEPPYLSPNPESPTFAEIANREGLNRETLISWLTDAHNYPEVMDFDLDPPQSGDIADYILSLHSEDYVRPKD